ncbi:hypothetical protein ACIA49_38605 [Kribbella sp. NPDC051587]|uniref:hypothetical protein n=1 Tax=Kribbella sp. NPDC051587 TaxID=3364119 RepID=UPI00378BE619
MTGWRGFEVLRAPELALLLYGVAGERSCYPDDVRAEWLRYWCEDQRACLMWLCVQLQRMGHAVGSLPESASSQVKRRLDQLETSTDDEVAATWLYATMPTGDYDCGDPELPLAQVMRSIKGFLDQDLLAERGGLLPGDCVVVAAIAPFASRSGLTSAELGVDPYQATVQEPVWGLDHREHTVIGGPPIAQLVAYRDLRTGQQRDYVRDVVASEHLRIDNSAWSPGTGLALLAPAALITIPALDPEREPAGQDQLDNKYRALIFASESLPLAPGRELVLRDPADKYRSAALARLWRLRDKELRDVGETDPRYIAGRILNDPAYPAPTPRTSQQLQEDEVSEQSALVSRARRPRSRQAPADRQLVTGQRRDALIQWLKLVTRNFTTGRVSAALDGFTRSTSLITVRSLLAVEGFIEVADLYGNAGTPLTPADVKQGWTGDIQVPRILAEAPDDVGLGRVEVVFAHPVDGHLVSVRAHGGDAGLKVDEVRLWFKVLPLDWALFVYAFSSGSPEQNAAHELTGVYEGSFTTQPSYGGMGGSLRVQLALLRAFTVPAWTPLTRLRLGTDGADQTPLYEALHKQAPDWVRRLTPVPPQQR